MPHDLSVATVTRSSRHGLIRMDEVEEPWLVWHLSSRVGGSFRRTYFSTKWGRDLQEIFPRSIFWVCDLVPEPRCDNPHKAVGILWIAGCQEIGSACAVTYLSAGTHPVHYMPEILRHFQSSYGLRRLP